MKDWASDFLALACLCGLFWLAIMAIHIFG